MKRFICLILGHRFSSWKRIPHEKTAWRTCKRCGVMEVIEGGNAD